MILQKFDYDTTGLPAVVNDLSLELITRSFFEGKTGSKFAKQAGIKSTEDLHYIDTDLYYQTDTGCGFTASGDVRFSKRTISVGKIKIQQEFCAQDLEGFWTERALKPGTKYDYIAFEQDWMNYLTGLMTEAKEIALWQSNISSGTGNYSEYDGFIAIIDAASALTINGNPNSVTGITTGNVIGIVDTMWTLLPSKLKGKPDVEFMMGSDTFDKLIVALKNENLYHYNGVQSNPYEAGVIILPGSGYRVERYFGLDGTNRIFLARTSNFVIGTDLESDSDRFDIREDPRTRAMLVDIHFKEGTQVKLPNEIVQFKLA